MHTSYPIIGKVRKIFYTNIIEKIEKYASKSVLR